MLNITVGEAGAELSLRAKPIAPWTAELTSTYQAARTDLRDRDLIVDLRTLMATSPEGEDILLQLIREKVKFLGGVYTKEVLRPLGRMARAETYGTQQDEYTDYDI
jgi:hypothetical protein